MWHSRYPVLYATIAIEFKSIQGSRYAVIAELSSLTLCYMIERRIIIAPYMAVHSSLRTQTQVSVQGDVALCLEYSSLSW